MTKVRGATIAVKGCRVTFSQRFWRVVVTANRDQAEHFAASLAGSIKEPATIQVVPEGSSSVFPRILHGRFDQLWNDLEWLNERGAGIFLTVNETDSSGRRAENVTRVRALFIDLDGAPMPTTFALEPHLVVETSPERFHAYWLCDGVPLDDFAALQKALAQLFGADPSVCDAPRCMRLPGFFHQKGAPTMVRLVAQCTSERYTYTELLAAWPELGDALTAREQARVEAAARCQRARLNPVKASTERVQRLLQAHHDAVADALEGERHGILLRHARVLGGYVGSGTVGLEDATEALTAAAEVCGLPEVEAAAAIRWGLERGQNEPLYLEAKRLDEHACSSKNFPSPSHKQGFDEQLTTQQGQAWGSDSTPWEQGDSGWR